MNNNTHMNPSHRDRSYGDHSKTSPRRRGGGNDQGKMSPSNARRSGHHHHGSGLGYSSHYHQKNSPKSNKKTPSHGRSRSFNEIFNKRGGAGHGGGATSSGATYAMMDEAFRRGSPLHRSGGGGSGIHRSYTQTQDGNSSVSSFSVAPTHSQYPHIHTPSPLSSTVPSDPTAMHHALVSRTTTVQQLRIHLLARPSAVSIADRAGRLPLHLLGLNRELFTYHYRTGSIHVLNAFVVELFEAYPMASIRTDCEGRLPFTHAIRSWIDASHELEGSATNNPSSVGADVIQIPPARHDHDELGLLTGNSSPQPYRRNDNRVRTLGRVQPWQRNHSRDPHKTLPNAGGGGGSVATATVSNMNSSATNSIDMNSMAGWTMDDVVPTRVHMEPMVEWNFRMLSKMLDIFLYDAATGRSDKYRTSSSMDQTNVENNNVHTIQGQTQTSKDEDISNDPGWLASVLMSGVASIPCIAKILLLLSDPIQPELLKYSMVRAVLRSPHAVGNWLVNMLEHPNTIVSSAAIDYLEFISDTTTTTTQKNVDLLYAKVGNLDYFLIAMLGMSDSTSVQRGAATEVVQYIINVVLATPPVVGIAFFDLASHFVLIFTYRHFCSLYLVENARSGPGFASYYCSLISILYLLIRKMSHISTMMKMSWNSFRVYCTRPVDLLDISSLLLAMMTLFVVEIQIIRERLPEGWLIELLASTIILLWVKLLVYVASVNLELRSAISSLWQTLLKVRSLVITLAVCVLAFSQSMHVLSYQSPCDDSVDCSYPILRSYSLLMMRGGEDDAYLATPFSTFLFGLFSILSIWLSFAILAQMVCTFVPLKCGVARLVYYTEVKTFQRLVCSGRWSVVQYCAIVLFISTTTVLIVISIQSVRDAILKYHHDAAMIGGLVVLVLFLVISIVAFLSHLTFYDLMDFHHRNNPHAVLDQRRRGCFGSIVRQSMSLAQTLSKPFRVTILTILGLYHQSPQRPQSEKNSATSSPHPDILREEVKAIESRLSELQSRNKAEMMSQIRSSGDRIYAIARELESMIDSLQKKPTS